MYNKILFFLIGIIFSSCAGNFGNIAQYEYKVPLETMYSYIDTIYKKYPQIEVYPEDSLNYDFRYESRWYYLKFVKNMTTYEIKFSFSIDPYSMEQYKNMCTISLMSGRKKGEVMVYASDLSNADRELYKNLFEEEFLSKLDSLFNIKGEEI